MNNFIIHSIAGINFLDTITKNGILLSEEEANRFILGNLIPDSSEIRLEESHFINNSDLKKYIKSPNIDIFLSKYKDIIPNDISLLGYLYHLYTEYHFYNSIVKKSFTFLDQNYQNSSYTIESKYVYIKTKKKYLQIKDFYKRDIEVSIYEEYKTLNKLLLNLFNYETNLNELLHFVPFFNNPGIEEVNYNNIISILSKTDSILIESFNAQNKQLNIFNYHDIMDFFYNLSSTFIMKYKEFIDEYIENNKKIKVLS